MVFFRVLFTRAGASMTSGPSVAHTALVDSRSTPTVCSADLRCARTRPRCVMVARRSANPARPPHPTTAQPPPERGAIPRRALLRGRPSRADRPPGTEALPAASEAWMSQRGPLCASRAREDTCRTTRGGAVHPGPDFAAAQTLRRGGLAGAGPEGGRLRGWGGRGGLGPPHEHVTGLPDGASSVSADLHRAARRRTSEGAENALLGERGHGAPLRREPSAHPGEAAAASGGWEGKLTRCATRDPGPTVIVQRRRTRLRPSCPPGPRPDDDVVTGVERRRPS